MIPHRTRQRLEGLAGALTELVETIEHAQSNTGPPTQDQIMRHTMGGIVPE